MERVPSVNVAVDSYLESMALEGRSVEARRARRYLLAPVRKLDFSIYDLTPQVCRRLILERHQAVQLSSVRTFVQGLSAFCTFCLEQGWIVEHPMKGIKRPRVQPKPHRYLASPQLKALWHAAANPYDRLAVALLGGCGLRISEATSLRWDRVNWTEGSIEVLGKGSKWRALDAGVVLPLLAALPRPRSGLVFPFGSDALRIRIQRLGRAIGLTWRLKPHELRHSFAVLFLEASDEDAFTLQQVLGHSDPEMTGLYVRSVRQRAAIRKMRRVDLAGQLFGNGD